MIVADIRYIDVKDSNKAYSEVIFKDVTVTTGVDEFGETIETVTENSIIAERLYEFPQPTTNEVIEEFIESERSKL
jgi:hypothetical protein